MNSARQQIRRDNVVVVLRFRKNEEEKRGCDSGYTTYKVSVTSNYIAEACMTTTIVSPDVIDNEMRTTKTL